MWPANGNNPTIPPILLKNFDPFKILQPQIGGNTSDGPRVGRLIDLDDFTSNSDINASLMDQKTEYSNLDLYENMYVTPQLVKRKENSTRNSTNDIDFNDFFDKCENGVRVDWTQDSLTKKEADNNDVDYDRKTKVLEPKLSIEEDPDELFYEVLSMRDKERHLYELNKKSGDNIPKNNDNDLNMELSQIKVLAAPSISDLKAFNNTSSRTNNPTPSTSRDEKLKFDIATELSRLKLIKQPNDDKKVPHSSNLKIDNMPTFRIIAKEKDEKAFKKKRIIRPESQTCNYTKGVDFQVKSNVLPQIMARIMTRQTYLLEQSKLKKRLVLDTGRNSNDDIPKCNAKKNNASSIFLNSNETKKCCNCSSSKETKAVGKGDDDFGKLNPIVLMEDCNKERLRAWKHSQMFKNFALNSK